MTLRNIVGRICLVKDFSLDELAVIVGRDEDYLRKNVVTPLQRQGVLEYTNPQPNYPRQRYRTRRPNSTEAKGNG